MTHLALLHLVLLLATRLSKTPASVLRVADAHVQAILATRKFREQSALSSRYPSTFRGFIEDVLGMTLTPNQEEIVQAVQDAMNGKGPRKIAIKSCHGSGKTRVLAAVAIAFLHMYSYSKVVTTGPGGTQIKEGLWQDIRFLFDHSKKRLMGEPSSTRWEIAAGWFAFGYKPPKGRAANMAGIHAPKMLLLIDEGAELEKPIYDALQGLLTSDDVVTVMPGNPTQTGNVFYEAFTKNASQWKRITISAFDTPNLIASGSTDERHLTRDVVVVPGLTTTRWVRDTIAEHGLESDYVQSRVFARFPKNAANAYVPQDWIDEAEKRFVLPTWSLPLEFGIDVARSGSDMTVLTARQGSYVYPTREWHGYDLMRSANRVKREALWLLEYSRRLSAKFRPDVPYSPKIGLVKVDETGLGSGLLDRLEEMRLLGEFPCDRTLGFLFGGSATDKSEFVNAGDEAWWALREEFQQGAIGGTITARLIEDVTNRRSKYVSNKLYPHLEPKDKFKERVGRSPDHGDSYAMAFWNPEGRSGPVVAGISVVRSGGFEQHGAWDDEGTAWPS